MNAHNIAGPATASQALAAGLAPFDDAILVHCTRCRTIPWRKSAIASSVIPMPDVGRNADMADNAVTSR